MAEPKFSMSLKDIAGNEGEWILTQFSNPNRVILKCYSHPKGPQRDIVIEGTILTAPASGPVLTKT